MSQPPSASPLSNLFARAAEWSMRLPRRRAWWIVIVAVILTIALDLATGPQVNVVVLYLGIACLASWCLGERTGLAVSAVAVFMLGWGNHFGVLAAGAHISTGAMVWNMVGRALSMAVMVALASGLRHSLDQARWSASTDALTGALNKAAFQRQLGPIVSQTQRRGEALVLAYIDLDGFKGVNDGFGHAAGDQLLRIFAGRASEAIRAHDLFARIGGDEFVTLLTVPTCSQGDTAAERLHDRLTRILRETGHAVTCSTGAMVVEAADIPDPDKLVQAADDLMYQVKRSGKNALRVARLDLQPAGPRAVLTAVPDRRRPALLEDAA
jgi:diguanylate cyclase (GGDEF)-like protein